MSPNPLPLVPAFLCLTIPAALLPAQGGQEPDRSALEREFTQLMSGCKMVGKFTMRGSDKAPQTDSYTISKVEKVRGSKWRFHAKIEYAGRSVTVPILLDVKWAGDTPVIQVTDMAIPMLGTYSARVVVYRNEYAGVWSGKGYGGQMYGKIKRQAATAKGSNWPGWRGPAGTAIGSGKPPTTWDSDSGENIRWKLPLPGRGSSSPVVWGNRVYVTTAIETDKEGDGAADAGGRRGGSRGFGSARPTKIHDFVVIAVERRSGEIAWRKTVVSAVPHEGGHSTATQASHSSVTDGTHLYAHFGSRGLYCLDLDGEVKWSKDFGKMRTAMSFGEGSSPTLHGDTVLVPWDHEGESFLVALDKRTGDEKWRVPRRQGTTWSTPLVVEVDGRAQVIAPGRRSSMGYDLATGEEIWHISGLTGNPIPSPLYGDGVVYLMSGFMGSALQAIKLSGAKGDLRGTSQVLFEHNRNTPYTPTGLVYGDYLYFLRVNSGVLSCLNAKTGEVYYEGQRLRRIGTTYSSIVGANGMVYITSRRGWTKVLKVGPKYEEVSSNRIKDTVDATLALAGDEIFLRGWEALYCIAEKGRE